MLRTNYCVIFVNFLYYNDLTDNTRCLLLHNLGFYIWQALWVCIAWTFLCRPWMPHTIFTGVYIGYALVNASSITWLYYVGKLLPDSCMCYTFFLPSILLPNSCNTCWLLVQDPFSTPQGRCDTDLDPSHQWTVLLCYLDYHCFTY